MVRLYLSIALLFFYPLIGAAESQAGEPHRADKFIEAATRQGLSTDPQWLALLHYHRNALSAGYTSYADDPLFFLSPEGKVDPAAELRATLEAWFDRAPRAPWNQPPSCVFVSRYAWLKEKLGDLSGQAPNIACPSFKEWFDLISPKGLTIVFASSYMNNPASAFGHTFLRIDQSGQKADSRLLAYSANYSANAVDENALLYALRGIFGGYSGNFAVAPYYEKVKLYGDLERRDLWEYHLALTPEEVTRAVQHLWELRQIGFDYFYFDENCSFQLLSILEVARPTLKLLDQFSGWVVPVDTIRAVVNSPGLLAGVTFRPSAETRLFNRIQHAALATQTLAKRLAESGLTRENGSQLVQLPKAAQAQAIDLAYEYLDYRVQSTAGRLPTEERREIELLKARSTIPEAGDVPAPPTPQVRPDQGHLGQKLSLSSGYYREHEFIEAAFQPTFHSLSDPVAGYIPGTQIEAFSFSGRWLAGEGVKLQRFSLLDLTSLTPGNRFVKPLSWNLHLLSEAEPSHKSNSKQVQKIGGGFGAARELFSGVSGYALLSPELQSEDWFADRFGVGLGPRVGLLAQEVGALQFLADAYYRQRLAGTGDSKLYARAIVSRALSSNSAVDLEARRDWSRGADRVELKLTLNLFF